MSIKLYDIDGYGLGEVLRMLFWYTKTKYEDIRIPYAEMKAKIAEWDLGRLPCIEIEGKKMNESLSLLRYFGQKFSK
jgi:hypothetical protein